MPSWTRCRLLRWPGTSEKEVGGCLGAPNWPRRRGGLRSRPGRAGKRRRYFAAPRRGAKRGAPEPRGWAAAPTCQSPGRRPAALNRSGAFLCPSRLHRRLFWACIRPGIFSSRFPWQAHNLRPHPWFKGAASRRWVAWHCVGAPQVMPRGSRRIHWQRLPLWCSTSMGRAITAGCRGRTPPKVALLWPAPHGACSGPRSHS